MADRPAFAEIEVTSDEILIRRFVSESLGAEIMDQVYALLLEAADRIASARSPWDGEDVDGEAAYFAVNADVAGVLRDVISDARRSQRSTRKMMPSGKK